jgi:uncharacterized protein
MDNSLFGKSSVGRIGKYLRAMIVVLALLPLIAAAKDSDTLNEQLIKAASTGDPEPVNTLLTEGADINAKDLCGRTALTWASNLGRTQVLKLLLDKKADVHARDESGRTALMWAAKQRHAGVVKLLLENKADANAKDDYGETALTLAISLMDNDFIAQMEKCCPVDREEKDCFTDFTPPLPPWVRAAERTHVVKLLQTQGADEALIVTAATPNDMKEVQRLLDAGADVRAKAPNGATALMMAVECTGDRGDPSVLFLASAP